jgi:ribosomal protein S18 acetylase RimI-like enzyme
VALDKGQVIGFCGMAVESENRTAHIAQIFVHPRYRRWGIGTHLLHCCLDFGREEGLRAVQAQAPISNPGWGVYLKAGFQVSGFTNDYYARQTKGSSAAQSPSSPRGARQTALLLTYRL